jgi:DNA-binding FadR family transcriptional regulator
MLVARRIVRDIVRRGLRPGDLLPPERSMLEQYEIARGTLREALRLLEFQGVLALKPGPGGGPVLLDPDASHLADTVVLLMQLKQSPFRTIVEVRTALEPMIAGLAARRIGTDSLTELDDTITAMRENIEDQHVFLEANKRFHDVIAWSSGNALFGFMVESLLDIMDGTLVGIDYANPGRKAILTAHERVLAAIRSGDVTASEDRMREHIDEYVRHVERKFPDVLRRVIRWDSAVG